MRTLHTIIAPYRPIMVIGRYSDCQNPRHEGDPRRVREDNHELCLMQILGITNAWTTGNIWYCECRECEGAVVGFQHIWYETTEERRQNLHQQDGKRYYCPQCIDKNHPFEGRGLPIHTHGHRNHYGECDECGQYDQDLDFMGEHNYGEDGFCTVCDEEERH